MELFYINTENITNNQIIIDHEESHHILKVLRKNINDEIFITDGVGYLYTCKIIINHRNKLICEIINKVLQPIPKVKIIALVPILKVPSRFEIILEKMVELGVSEIYPFISHNSSVKDKKESPRWIKILISGIKQSKKYYLPIIHNVNDIEKIAKIDFGKNSFKMFGDLETNSRIEEDLSNYKEIVFCIGPEGDLTLEEKNILKQNHFIPITLGKNILRAETAAISLAAIINSKID